jgi:hypothetical protein
MKKFIVALSILTSFAASASEIKVMDLDARTAGRGSLSTRFDVNLQDGTADLRLTVSRRHGGKNPHTTTRRFSKNVPELSLKDKTLELNIDGKITDCGTMGETRVFNRPVLRLSGKCEVVAKRVNGGVVVLLTAE